MLREKVPALLHGGWPNKLRDDLVPVNRARRYFARRVGFESRVLKKGFGLLACETTLRQLRDHVFYALVF